MPETILRAATVTDAADLAATVQEGFESYRAWAPRGWEPPSAAFQLRGIRDRLPEASCVCVLAEVDGAPAGQAAFSPARDEPGVAHVWMLFVREPFWGTGLATRLLARAVEEASAVSRYTAMRLHTPAEHVRARRFYEREGWTADAPPFYEPMLGLTLVTYRRALAPEE
jgi:GNAT superfamily N-acetyltransferase